MTNQADEDKGKPWVIRDVPEGTRRDVKAYAAKNGMTVAQALTILVASGLGKVETVELTPPLDLSNAAEINRLIRFLEDLKIHAEGSEPK